MSLAAAMCKITAGHLRVTGPVYTRWYYLTGCLSRQFPHSSSSILADTAESARLQSRGSRGGGATEPRTPARHRALDRPGGPEPRTAGGPQSRGPPGTQSRGHKAANHYIKYVTLSYRSCRTSLT